jgi:hypothetical protein
VVATEIAAAYYLPLVVPTELVPSSIVHAKLKKRGEAVHPSRPLSRRSQKRSYTTFTVSLWLRGMLLKKYIKRPTRVVALTEAGLVGVES